LIQFEEAVEDPILQSAIIDTRSKFFEPKEETLYEIFPRIMELEFDRSKPCFVLVSLGRSKERDREARVLDSLLIEYGDFFQVIELTIGGNQRTPTTWPQMDVLAAQELLDGLLIFQLPWYGWMEIDGKIEESIDKPSVNLEERLFAIRAKKRSENKIKVGQ
jgi:hypothetical protein